MTWCRRGVGDGVGAGSSPGCVRVCARSGRAAGCYGVYPVTGGRGDGEGDVGGGLRLWAEDVAPFTVERVDGDVCRRCRPGVVCGDAGGGGVGGDVCRRGGVGGDVSVPDSSPGVSPSMCSIRTSPSGDGVYPVTDEVEVTVTATLAEGYVFGPLRTWWRSRRRGTATYAVEWMSTRCRVWRLRRRWRRRSRCVTWCGVVGVGDGAGRRWGCPSLCRSGCRRRVMVCPVR